MSPNKLLTITNHGASNSLSVHLLFNLDWILTYRAYFCIYLFFFFENEFDYFFVPFYDVKRFIILLNNFVNIAEKDPSTRLKRLLILQISHKTRRVQFLCMKRIFSLLRTQLQEKPASRLMRRRHYHRSTLLLLLLLLRTLATQNVILICRVHLFGNMRHILEITSCQLIFYSPRFGTNTKSSHMDIGYFLCIYFAILAIQVTLVAGTAPANLLMEQEYLVLIVLLVLYVWHLWCFDFPENLQLCEQSAPFTAVEGYFFIRD